MLPDTARRLLTDPNCVRDLTIREADVLCVTAGLLPPRSLLEPAETYADRVRVAIIAADKANGRYAKEHSDQLTF